ncbi:MAG: CotH kinase family protein [Ilumatobacteraceae bacterium]|nr:CotH kinase family protein [Ilumatobacteraceae bacterium]
MRRRIHITLTALLATSGAIVATPVAPAQAATPRVVINELYYNPLDDNPASEYLELFNASGSNVDLSGWCIDGIDFCFPGGGSIAANGYLIVTGDRYEGALSNGGEDITLLDSSGTTVDFVEYDDKEEWPASADGEGDSLQRRDPNAESNTPGNWESRGPTPGTPNASLAAGLLPSFSDVEHTELPAAGAPIQVTAELKYASGANLRYRLGFGPEIVVPMTVTGGVATGTIPGQSAGSLVRYRLTSSKGGRTGSWPRQGDGSTYRGTTVARSVDTELPLFEIFMPDDDFETMAADITLSGDDGYPMVFAYEGQVFDNARIRVKGQVSRTFPKKKFKIILPFGYDLEDDELFPDDVDEWGMHSAWADKSFLRETLASEFMTAAGAAAQQAFPVRFERNNQFLGLYTYVEQPDGTYRDRYGLDDSEVYEVGPDNLYGLLAANDANRSQDSLRARYDKETFEYLDDDELRRFIASVNSLSGVSERTWIYDNVDVPSVVNILAASMVIQNQDYGHKNYRLVFDQYGRVGVEQNDYDLTFGRRWSNVFGALDSRVYVGGYFEHPGGPFFETFFFDTELSAMVRRRVRTLTEEQLNPSTLSDRVNELSAMIRPEAVADRAVWGTYGGAADPTAEGRRIIDSFVVPQHRRILVELAASGRVAPNPQPAVPAVIIDDVRYDGVEHVSIRNVSGDSVDLSGFEIPELDLTIPGGTVLLAGRSAIFAHEDVPWLRDAYRGVLVAGVFEESVRDAEEGLTLRNRAGDLVTAWTKLPPGVLSEISGEPDRSGFVSLVATETAAPGYLQMLPCDDDPGATSNLNVDAAGQTRSTLALTRFADDGTACVFNLAATHVVADVQGYFRDGALDDVDDHRLIDSRTGRMLADGAVTTISGGRPNETGIVSLVATETSAPGFVAIIPCDAKAPTTSNLNFDRPGMTVSALAFVEFDDRGAACVFTSAATHVVADVQGYLAADAFDDVDDERLVDTRDGGGPAPAARSLTVLRGRPESVGIVSLVATQTQAPGYLQVLPCDGTPGATSNVNYDRPGATGNGLTTVEFGPEGSACVYTLAPAHIVADLQGYFVGDAFEDVPDQRLLDSRLR